MKSSQRALLGVLACALALALSASKAQAYAYLEHQRIGHDAYLHACSLLQRYAGEGAGELNGARLEAACPRDAYLRELRASAYGQGVALSADHVAQPDWFTDTSGLREALSVFKYLTKALENAEHFHPTNKLKWHELHQCALDTAGGTDAACWRPPRQPALKQPADDEARFLRILFVSAFADHFLQDSFAAGHMGFNRPASAPIASMLHHDYYSAEGRVVRSAVSNPTISEWATYGDNHLCDGNPELSAEAQAHQAYYATRPTGAIDGELWRSATCQADEQLPQGRLELLRTAHAHVYAATARSVLEVLAVFLAAPAAYGSQLAHAALLNDVVAVCGPESSRLCKLLGQRAELQLPVAYREDVGAQELTSLGDLSNGASLLFAPVVEMRFATGITGNRSYGYWMPAFGFRIRLFELIAGYAAPTLLRSREPQLWNRQNSSLYGRVVFETPPFNPYGSALALSFLVGPIGERCVQNCSSSRTDDNWRLGLTGGVRLTVEAAIAAISLSAEPFVAWNSDGKATFGLAVATSFAKPLVFRRTLRGGGRFHGPAF